MQVINNNLFAQVSSETSATVSGGSYGEYGYYPKGATLSYNYDNYLLALGVFYQNAPDVAKTLNVFSGTSLIGTTITHTNGITPEESLIASKLGFSSGGWW
ncbi:hypothetical protein [Anabaena sp. CCY 9910]|uniref:hypothetical protein n=1 Tax=Anabaena sp. CCY 9910 TaxID=3103870 RepID=UPI0039DFF8BC